MRSPRVRSRMPLSGLFSAAKAVEEMYRTLFAEKSTAKRQDAMVGFQEFEEMIGVPDWRDLEATYSVE